MLILSQGTGHLLRVITTIGGSDIEPIVTYVDKTGTGPASYSFAGVGDPLASITTATTTTLLAGAASTERALENVSLYNNHASVAETVEVLMEDGTHTSSIISCTLAAGESLIFDAAGGWTHYDANGAPYVGIGPMATQAEMEAATSLTTVVTPGRAHFHPGVAKCWVESTSNSTVILASYNITSLTDGAVGLTTVTIANDFSSANWACVLSRSEDDQTLVYSSTYNSKAAGSVILVSVVEAGSGSDPTSSAGNASFSMVGFGDL